jgi:hypothetical protein
MEFHIGDILSITDGRLISLDHIDGVYKILNYMTGESLMTHQLPRASKACRPILLKQFPKLASDDIKEKIDYLVKLLRYNQKEGTSKKDMKLLLVGYFGSKIIPKYGEFLDVSQIKRGDYERKNPIAEIVEMMS